ncbi:MAG: hypothetical protein WCG50_05280 [Rhodoferax sp.]|uniref:hypothetical protein n=1 Tax=Rhodoferax sp. TaxID=50421 RepID=UPI003019D5FD
MKNASLNGYQMLLAGLLASSFGVSESFAQTAAAPVATAKLGGDFAPTSAAWRARQGLYYKRNWGVEIIGVKPVSSGYMLSFKYRVLDPEKAKLLNDRQTRAFLRDEATGNVLSVPAMENVGELRTGAAPIADRTYFMIFGNPGKLVTSGSRVSVVAGAMHVDGLIVD